MRWLIENPQLLILIAGAIAYWLNQRRKEKTEREMEAELARKPTDDEMEERTRRIQEEIRRKIAERRGDLPPPLPQAPAPLAEVPPARTEVRPVVVTTSDMPGPMEIDRVLEEQRRYAEQIERLAAEELVLKERAAGMQHAFAVVSPTPVSGRPKATGAVRGLDRESLRRAIVLREVLGAPKALQ